VHERTIYLEVAGLFVVAGFACEWLFGLDWSAHKATWAGKTSHVKEMQLERSRHFTSPPHQPSSCRRRFALQFLPSQMCV
jgi:hypothetical protein